MTKDSAKILHLFSSDFRPLYVQDCLDLLAKPTGAIQRFRYQKDWVSASPEKSGPEPSDAEKADLWRKMGDQATDVIAYFAWVRNLPQGQNTLYVPLRRGKVVRAGVEENNYYFVEFSLGDFVDPLLYPSAATPDESVRFGQEKKTRLGSVTSAVRDLLGKYPSGTYEDKPSSGFSAVLRAAPVDYVSHSGAKWSSPDAFNNSSAALGELLSSRYSAGRHADVFMKTLRVRKLKQSGSPKKSDPSARSHGSSIELRAGNLYELDVLVIRTVDNPEAIRLTASTPRGCTMVSSETAVLSAKYDKATFRFFAEARDNPIVGEMTVRAALAATTAESPVLDLLCPAPVGTLVLPGTHPSKRWFRSMTARRHRGEPRTAAKIAPDGPPPFMPESRFQVRLKPRKFLTLSAVLAAFFTALAAFCAALIGQSGVYLGASSIITPGDNVIDASLLLGWLGGGTVFLSVSALAVASATAVSAGGAALFLLIRRRFGLSA